MPSHARRMRMVKRHHKQGHKKKGMSSRHRHKTSHKKAHKTKHVHKKSRSSHKAGGRAGGAKPGRRMDHYHMRRRFMHTGVAGGAFGMGMFGFDDDMEDNPFIDDGMFDDEGLLEDFDEEEETESESEGSDSEDNESQIEEEDPVILEGPPPLESEDHYHVFFYHSSAVEDQEQVDHYVNIIENRLKRGKKNPHDLKVLTSEKDFKSELSATQNLMLAMGLSQKTVLHCTQEFVENDLPNFDSCVQHVLQEDERKQRVIILLGADVPLPASLQKYTKILSLTDSDCFENLTRMLMSSHGRHHHASSSHDKSNLEPSAPPLDGSESPTNAAKDDNNTQEAKEITTIYSNGLVIKKVAACNYKSYESQNTAEQGLCTTYCPQSDLLCPRPEPIYVVPDSLTKRGLQVTQEEFNEILNSLNEAANVTFFQKAVDCTLPCLYLSAVLTVSFVSAAMWFLVAGATHHYQVGEESISGTLFWSFMIFVFFIPAATAFIMLGIVLHLVNYKYLKYRIKIEEFNKRFRDTNLVLHVRKGFWTCSGKLKLYFIYYNFEECQQSLYCHVHDNMKLANGVGEENEKLLNDIATVKLDKIMKRVNTLTKKFEWDYFEALTTQKLPAVEEKEHRKKGMCFCQYVLHSEQRSSPHTSVVEQVIGQVSSMKKNALKKSHKRRSIREPTPPPHYIAVTTTNGTPRFGDKKSSSVTFM